MIKFILRRTIYKAYDRESQDRLFQLELKKQIIRLWCSMFWTVMFIFQFFPILIIDSFDNAELSPLSKQVISGAPILWFIGYLILFIVFNKATMGFIELLAERVYYLLVVKKGQAILKEDLQTIKKENKKLHCLIETQLCRGYCYSICFQICKILQKGSLEFIAIKKFSQHNCKRDDGKNYTMHVLYLNNGWAFDTYSSRQFPIEDLHEIYQAKVYKKFSFDDISSKSYEEFKEEQEPALAEWSNENDCSMFSKGGNR